MPGNDERDPLDLWLRHEIQPLPPPEGTFELITKRARRRKLRKLAITVTSAAAVAAAVTVAVPTVLSLHLGQSSATGSQAASARSASQTPSGGATQPTQSAGSTASPSTTPTTGISESSQAAGYPTGGPVPPNFQPTSVTFIGKNTGWAIGQAGTPGTCHNVNPTICTSVVLTQDSGHTWRGVPAPDTNAVSGIRFLDGRNGWAYGAQLWSTHDYGNQWTQVSTGGQQVIDLETAGSQAFGLFATCTTSTPSDCSSYTLETTQAGTDNWAPVGPATTSLPGTPGMTPSIVLTGSTGWLMAADGTIYSGPLGGAWSKIGTAPCPATPSPNGGTLGGALLTWNAYTSTLVAACATKPFDNGTGPDQKQFVYTSADSGRTWQGPHVAPGRGALTSLATAPGAPAILATTAGLEIQPGGTGTGRLVAALPGGFSYVGMTSDTQGVALPANTSLHQIWMTRDGGQTWQPALTGS